MSRLLIQRRLLTLPEFRPSPFLAIKSLGRLDLVLVLVLPVLNLGARIAKAPGVVVVALRSLLVVQAGL